MKFRLRRSEKILYRRAGACSRRNCLSLRERWRAERDGEGKRTKKAPFNRSRAFDIEPSHPTPSGALPKGEPIMCTLNLRCGEVLCFAESEVSSRDEVKFC